MVSDLQKDLDSKLPNMELVTLCHTESWESDFKKVAQVGGKSSGSGLRLHILLLSKILQLSPGKPDS